MDAESFFARWSRRKTEARQDEQNQDGQKPAAAQPPAEKPEAPPPTLQDLEKLTYNADFSPFFARQVDEIIRRAAMKKLFADPRFNIMDGLDVYIEDYNKFEPLTPETVAKLNHAAALLNPVVEPKHKLMELLELEPPPEQEQAQAADGEAAQAKTQEPAADEPKAEAPPSPDTPPHDDQVQGM